MDSEQSNTAFNKDQEESNSNVPEVVPPVRFSNKVLEHNKPVQLISIKPLNDTIEGNTDSIGNHEETSRPTGLSKYNWKNFLPVARR